jgi:hypothetical protein
MVADCYLLFNFFLFRSFIITATRNDDDACFPKKAANKQQETNSQPADGGTLATTLTD